MCSTLYRHTNTATLHIPMGLAAAVVGHTAGAHAATAPGLVSPEVVACTAAVRFGDHALPEDRGGYRDYTRVSSAWLNGIVGRLESDYELLEQLEVVRNDTAIETGTSTDTRTGPVMGRRVRLLQPQGFPATTLTRSVESLKVVRLPSDRPISVRELHTDATYFGVLAEHARALLLGLVRDRFLLTQLRAPSTVIDPFGYLLNQLDQVRADDIASVASLVAELREIHTELSHHTAGRASETDTTALDIDIDRPRSLRTVIDRVRALSSTTHGHEDPGHSGPVVTVHRRLAGQVQLPTSLLGDVEQAASALYRLGRRPADPVWADYHRRFLSRYGTGLLVPVTRLLHPAAGLGYPAGYADSQYPTPATPDQSHRRDAAVLALAMSTVMTPVEDAHTDAAPAVDQGVREVVLDEATIAAITPPDRADPAAVPPHLDLAVTVHAATLDTITGGDYHLRVRAVAPAGTWTAASTLDALDDDVAVATRESVDEYTDFTEIDRDPVTRALRDAPPDTRHATRVQLSHAPTTQPTPRHGGGVPTCLPVIARLGEYPAWSAPHQVEAEVLELRHIGVFATPDRLHVAGLSGEILDPQLFTNRDTAPPLARFLADLNTGFARPITPFDWGPVSDQLPHLPRLRYGRVILSPARWRITTHDLHTPTGADDGGVVEALEAFRRRWACPTTIDLIAPTIEDLAAEDPVAHVFATAARGVGTGVEVPGNVSAPMQRLTLTDASHVDTLVRHIEAHGEAIVTEALHNTTATNSTDSTDSAYGGDLGWLGHAHDLVLPLVRRAAPAPSPVLPDDPPLAYSGAHGQFPGDPDVDSWTLVKVFTDPAVMTTLITESLPHLDVITGPVRVWYSRHPATTLDPAHLRVHLQPQPRTDETNGTGEPDVLDEARGLLGLVTDWAERLVQAGLTARVEYATYVPEDGVYGQYSLREDADAVHVADSALTTTLLTEWSRTPTPPTGSEDVELAAVAAASMVHIVRTFLRYDDLAYRWLTTHTPAPPQRSPRDALQTPATDPGTVACAVALAAADPRAPHSALPTAVREQWAARSEAVAQYSNGLPPELRDHTLAALLHAHTNRLGGLTPTSSDTQHYLHLARLAADILLHATGTTP